MLRRILFSLPLLFVIALPVRAICPICTVAVGAGIGLSRWLGIDDVITGLWIGALFVSISLWTIFWVVQKKWKFRGYKIAVFAFYAFLMIVPLFWMNVFFHPFNKLWGMDKLILGIFLGAASFILGSQLHFYLKKKNGNKVFFPFQKVVIPVGFILILNLFFYLITRN